MEGRKRLRDEGDDSAAASAAAASAATTAAAGGSSREELLALLAARDAQLAACSAQLSARSAQLAARDAQLAAAEAAGDAARASDASARAAAEAERAFARRLLARDATLAAALAERDELLSLVGGEAGLRAARLGERLIDVLPIVAAMGYACEVSHCLYLCGVTYRKGDKGATNDMLVKSLERQCGASAARAAEREDFDDINGDTSAGSTQLIRAVARSDLSRVLQLVQLGAPLELRTLDGYSALEWACIEGHERIAKALLDGKYEGRGAEIDAQDGEGHTPLICASIQGQEGVVRLLLARGAKVATRGKDGRTALSWATLGGEPNCAALLRAHGATI